MAAVRRLLVLPLGLAASAALLWAFFHLAGGWGWRDGWAYLGLLVFGHGVSTFWVWRHRPEVLRRRASIGAGTKRWDVAWLAVFGLLFLALLLVAAWDVGRREGPALSEGWRLVGMVLYAFFLSVITWCMVENPFFEKTVRIQRDRGQTVVCSGPYAIVRHPGYTATIVGFLFGPPLLLRAPWAFAPAVLGAVWVVVRTVLEDRTLRRELEGYEAYAAHVRRMLVPGVL